MIFDEKLSRKPDDYPWCREYIDCMWAGFWSPNEFTFNSDVQQFKTELSEEEKRIIVNSLSAIGQVEISVKTFWLKLGLNLPNPNLMDLGCVMSSIEVTHNLAYEKLLDCLNLGAVFQENLKLDIIQGRVKYLKKYNDKVYKDNKKQYIFSLILFTLFVENVSLFSQFYIILWFNRFRNVLKDTAQQVQYTKNEENIHALVGVKIVNTIKEEYPELFDLELETRILHEAEEAFKAESKIIDWMLGETSQENLSKEILKEYVKNRINESLERVGYRKIYQIDENLIEKTTWMSEEIHANAMTDFFNKKPTEYSKSNMSFAEESLF